MAAQFLRRGRQRICIYAAALAAVAAVGGDARGDATFINAWGSSGSGSGQFDSPEGIAVDPTGTVYVADTYNSRIESFNASGGYLSTFNNGNGQLDEPFDVAVAPSGNLYVADSENQRIVVFSSTGGYQSTIGTKGTAGTANNEFDLPEGVTVAPNGTVYVADTLNQRVQIFSGSNSYQSTIGGTGNDGSGNAQFSFPQGEAVGPTGDLYVADSGNDRIQIFDASGVYQNTIGSGTTSSLAGQFSGPQGVAVSSTGYIYVADNINNRVEVFTPAGEYESSFGTYGSGNGQFVFPTAVAVATTGMVYVADSGNDRVEQFFDPNSWSSGTNTFTNSAIGPTAVAVGPGQILGTSLTLTSAMGLAADSLTINAGGTLTMAGGSLLATATNNGTITGYGTMSGNITNNQTISLSGGNLIYSDSVSDTLTNATGATLTLPAGCQLEMESSVVSLLINNGLLNLNGGSVTQGGGSISFINGGNGLITGTGTIAVPFSNQGTVSLDSGVLSITAGFTSSGQIDTNSNSAQLSVTGTLVNAQTIQGIGTISTTALNNSGTILSTGYSLAIMGAVHNLTGGIFVAGAGTELSFPNGIASNAGLISLTGGTVDAGTGTITNIGQITGYGTIRSGLLTNNGAMTLTGGTSTVNGPVNNSTGRTINIEYQPAIFTGAVNNSGTILVSSTTVTFTGSYSGNAYVSDPSTNIFQANVTVVTGGVMTGGSGDQFYMSGGTFTNQGTFNNGGLLQSSDATFNSGSFTQSGAQNWSSGSTFTNRAGTATFASDAGAAGANLTVNTSGGSVNFASIQHLAGLNVGAGSTVEITGGSTGDRSIVFTPALTVTGTLDLTTDCLDVQGGGPSALTAVTAAIARGYSNGTWTGTGITSSSAASESSHLTAVGVILNTTASGTPIYTTFDGSAVALNDVLVKYTYYGDTNLDGKVDATDYSRIDNGYLNHLTGWFNGDFNYDGVVNGSDYTLIDNAYNMQGAQLSTEVATATDQISPTTVVPEPAALGLITIATASLLGRRRRIR